MLFLYAATAVLIPTRFTYLSFPPFLSPNARLQRRLVAMAVQNTSIPVPVSQPLCDYIQRLAKPKPKPKPIRSTSSHQSSQSQFVFVAHLLSPKSMTPSPKSLMASPGSACVCPRRSVLCMYLVLLGEHVQRPPKRSKEKENLHLKREREKILAQSPSPSGSCPTSTSRQLAHRCLGFTLVSPAIANSDASMFTMVHGVYQCRTRLA
ncbi:hypothetical protein C8R43DRAFT_470744 [Mycena crocata]|nr:hypothetical protein C8R43DRAFT_470744 [Mycena crocata]